MHVRKTIVAICGLMLMVAIPAASSVESIRVGALELAFWNTVRDSAKPAEFQAYLDAFPDGAFAPLARRRASQDVRVEAVEREYRVRANAAPAPDHDTIPRHERRPADNEAAAQIANAAPLLATEIIGAHGASLPFKDCDACPEMVTLPAGTFVQGDDGGDKRERPAHRVTLLSYFAIGRHEVTVGEWQACVAAGACGAVAGTDESADKTPIRNVNWNEAQDYVRWLSGRAGRTYRLPSESEWEYAARGGTQSRYWWGSELGIGMVACRSCGGPWNKASPGPVGAFPANPFGLHGMNGSVAEWTADCWQNSYENVPADGSSFAEPACQQRVLRGGSWRSSVPDFLTSTSRFFYDASVRYVANGFRVAADPI